MNFYRAYLRTLFWKPHVAIAAMFWWCVGRKVRARNRLRMVTVQRRYAYEAWIDTIEQQPRVLAGAAAAMSGWQYRPLLSLILLQDAMSDTECSRLIESLAAQTWHKWELVVVSGPDKPPLCSCQVPKLTLVEGRADDVEEALELALDAATGDYILPLLRNTVLPSTALFRYVEALQDAPEATVLYGDHDQIDTRGNRSMPWFKPRWNPDLFLAQDYLSAACLIRSDAARRALPIAPATADAACYALLLAVTARENAEVVHVPHIQNHTPRTLGPDNQAARLAVVRRHLAQRGAVAQSGPFGTLSVVWPLPDTPPLVSIIVPTRDQLRLLRNCVYGVLTATSYKPFELIIVDNGSREVETLTYLEQVSANPQVRVLRYDEPFNFSAINNFAVRHAKGSFLCLLNNDIEIIDEDWLTALMRQAVRPEVGAAGAKLLYEDGTIQHAGVVIGLGEAAGHAHRYQRDDKAGYFARAHVAHRASAVTAACLVVEKAKFEAVGGLDEANFAVAFNDVDLCLKLDRAGWHNLYVPQALAVHHESKSRGRDFLPANIDRYMSELAVLQQRWATVGYNDPLHHPHLDKYSETYVIQLAIASDWDSCPH